MRPYVYPCSRTSKAFCTSLIDPMNILHSGSWEAFRRVAVRKKIPEDILMMILLFIKKEQLSEIVDHIRIYTSRVSEMKKKKEMMNGFVGEKINIFLKVKKNVFKDQNVIRVDFVFIQIKGSILSNIKN